MNPEPSNPVSIEPLVNALAAAIAPYLVAHLKAESSAMEKAQEEQLLSQKEAAAFLDCNVNTLIKWGQKGLINPLKRGNRVYYRKSDLLSFNGKN